MQCRAGGLLGSYAIEDGGEFKPTYGLKAFSPVAAGYGYSRCSDFGNQRSFGFARKHLGNDLMGGLGTPIIAVEGCVVEAMTWIRSSTRAHDRRHPDWETEKCIKFPLKKYTSGFDKTHTLWYTYSDKNEAGGICYDKRNRKAQERWL